jgi:hypothetical protein
MIINNIDGTEAELQMMEGFDDAGSAGNYYLDTY